MNTMSVTEAAEKWGLSAARVRLLVTTNRIDGVEKVYVRGLPEWRIPASAPRPEKITPGPKPANEKQLQKTPKKVSRKRTKRR